MPCSRRWLLRSRPPRKEACSPTLPKSFAHAKWVKPLPLRTKTREPPVMKRTARAGAFSLGRSVNSRAVGSRRAFGGRALPFHAELYFLHLCPGKSSANGIDPHLLLRLQFHSPR